MAANAVRKQLRDLSYKNCFAVQPVFVRKKTLQQDLKFKEIKPSVVDRQWVVYYFTVICAMLIMLGIQPDTFTKTTHC